MVVTRPNPACGHPLRDVVARCVRAGSTAVELRHKTATGRALFEQARALLPVVREAGALLLVNDRLDVALAAEADGVHLGPEDFPVRAARRIAGPGFLIGYSTDDPARAKAAARDGADYLGVGAVFGSHTKAGLREEAIGPRRVREVLDAAGLPGVGIGGITAANAGEVARAGAGVAVVGAVMDAEDPAAAARTLRREIDAAWR